MTAVWESCNVWVKTAIEKLSIETPVKLRQSVITAVDDVGATAQRNTCTCENGLWFWLLCKPDELFMEGVVKGCQCVCEREEAIVC